MPKAIAILLKKIPLTDTSLIVSWCCQEQGLIRTAAKGARRPGSPLAGKLDLFYEAEIEIVPSRRGDLHALKEAEVTNYRHGLQTSFNRILAGSYFVRLIEMVAERETPIAALFDLLRRALDWLCVQEPTVNGVLHFERELATELGLWHSGDATPPLKTIQDLCHRVPEQRLVLLERLR
ncbi:MAG: recombination protein O N-terminal domain-containing protein [Verrucomicrobiales bacterium]|nr:recombination protein O N-terminal domain-containing protein [Verrucomicrobiales bacterium]